MPVQVRLPLTVRLFDPLFRVPTTVRSPLTLILPPAVREPLDTEMFTAVSPPVTVTAAPVFIVRLFRAVVCKEVPPVIITVDPDCVNPIVISTLPAEVIVPLPASNEPPIILTPSAAKEPLSSEILPPLSVKLFPVQFIFPVPDTFIVDAPSVNAPAP